ncbi:unnamed protein product [Amoebophrya sp. A120]|nr:unnamed protein product [Amoebophrya sp. A120]|eukprot:GSA120T00005780001.1
MASTAVNPRSFSRWFAHQPLLLTLVVLLLSGVDLAFSKAPEQIDPNIYARLFQNNRPTFDHIASKVLADLPESRNGVATVLDLASGPGEPSVTLAVMDKDAPKLAKITTTDFQSMMVEKAKWRAEIEHVEDKLAFATTSADDLSQFADGSFDAVTMSFGLMFVPDRQKSLQEIARVLRPGGRAYLSVWKELPFQTFARYVLEQIAGEEKKATLPPFAINPLALQAENAVESLAENANLVVKGDERLSYDFHMGTYKETADGLRILAGTLLKEIEEEQPGAQARFDSLVQAEMEARGWTGGAIPDNSPQILTLQKPAQGEASDL